MSLIENYGTSTVTQDGFFTQGSVAAFVVHFYDLDGNYYDPSSIYVEILDPDDTEVITYDGMQKLELGVYASKYIIASDAETGAYTFKYTFITNTTSGAETRTLEENFIVIEKLASPVVEAQRIIMKNYLETLIRKMQHIPVRTEQVEWVDNTRTIAKLTFGNWNQIAGVEVHRNNNLITSGYEVDYLNGKITFDNALDDTDVVDVNYNFQWFNSNEIAAFLDSGIMRTNYFPPVTSYTYGTTPPYWLYVSTWGSAVDAIRTIIMDLIHQEPQIVFGGPEAAQQVISTLDSLKKNYEEDLNKALDLKKYGPYVGLTNMTIVPEYTLPGGRSRWFRMLFSGSGDA